MTIVIVWKLHFDLHFKIHSSCIQGTREIQNNAKPPSF